jgi:hypothetical protein
VAYLADDLITAVRDSGMLPANESSANSAKLLLMMNREQRGYLTKLLLSVREQYLLDTLSIPIVAGVTAYALPRRAVVSGVKQVESIDSAGNPVLLTPWPDERQDERMLYGGPGKYYLAGNTLQLLQFAPGTIATLKVTYYRRLSDLVLQTSAGAVSAINTGAQTVTVSSVPAGWVAGATLYDFTQSLPQYDVLGSDRSATLAGSTLTFSVALPSSPTALAVGDFVTLAQQSCVCQAPLELHDVLVMRTCYAWLRAKGDPKAAVALEALKEMEEAAISLLAPRIEAPNKALVNFNSPGWTRFRGWRRRFWWNA